MPQQHLTCLVPWGMACLPEPFGDIAMSLTWPVVLSRVLAAAIGGYLAAWSLAFTLATLLPMARASVWFLCHLLTPLALLSALLWAFAAKTSARAWGVPLLLALAGGLSSLLLREIK